MRGIESARQAAGRALTVGSIVLGVWTGLGSHTLHQAAQWAAIGCLLLALGVVIYVWWPRTFRCGTDAKKAIDAYIEHPRVGGQPVESLSLSDLYLKRAGHLGEDIDYNRPKLNRLQICVSIVLVLTVLVILAVVLGSIGLEPGQEETGAAVLNRIEFRLMR